MGRKRSKAIPARQIAYDSTPIPEAANYKHLGIIQSTSGKYPYDIDAVKQTIRGTFLSLSQVSGRSGANPNTAIKLYKTAVIPKALFGCELWNSISIADMQQLEVAHHFCLKRAQGLPPSHALRHGARPCGNDFHGSAYRPAKISIPWLTMPRSYRRTVPHAFHFKTVSV
ncbi:hypothetical protein DPMN_000026 [Dreissena polymorpha]|uniref:Uncharacterized protein n=1 Tax=Dreissena polymorpha TaxID=45954 RepID=A0A9D4MIX4_DREPO|nr:hypothetical protein DPMN_000026 [Dreissena polymorpha]